MYNRKSLGPRMDPWRTPAFKYRTWNSIRPTDQMPDYIRAEST